MYWQNNNSKNMLYFLLKCKITVKTSIADGLTVPNTLTVYGRCRHELRLPRMGLLNVIGIQRDTDVADVYKGN